MSAETSPRIGSIAARVLPMTLQDMLDHLEERTTNADPITIEDLRALAASCMAQIEAEPKIHDREATPPSEGEVGANDAPWMDVTSSHIKAVRYDDFTQELSLRFKDGAVWTYAGVPPEHITNMLTGGSVGVYYASKIKGLYPAKKEN